MPDNPEVKVVLTAEDQGVSAAIRQLGKELQGLKTQQDGVESSSRRASKGFLSLKDTAVSALDAIKLRIANLPGLGNFGSSLALRAYEPVGRMLEQSGENLEEKFGGAAVAVGGVAAAVAALGAIAVGVTKHMMDLAQSIENTSAATGLSTEQVQVYNELAKEMDVDAGSLETAFSRIQVQLGEFVVTGKSAGEGSQNFIRVMQQMGIALIGTDGHVRNASDVLADFYDALNKIPNAEDRAALEGVALGTRGRVIAQMFEEARRAGISYRDMLQKIQESGIVIPDSQLEQLDKAKAKWEDVTRSIRSAAYQFGTFLALSVTSKEGFERGALTTALSLGTLLPAKNVNAWVEKVFPEKGAGPGQSADAKARSAALFQILSQNSAYEEQLAVLRAGGKMQHDLAVAEQERAVAVKQGDADRVKSLDVQIHDLREIIALEAAKKHTRLDLEAPGEAAKAQLALTLKTQQDLLDIWKAGAAQRAEADKGEYQKGAISLADYFAGRRAEIQAETTKEIAVLERERDQVQAAATAAGERAATARGAIAAAGTPEEKRQLTQEADRYTAEQLNGLARVDALNTQITERQIASKTKAIQLDAEQFRAESAQKQKILEFLRQIEDLEGKGSAAGAKDQIEAKTQEMRTVLEQMKGQTVGGVTLDSAGIDRLIAQYEQLAAAKARDAALDAQFSAAEKTAEEGIKSLESQRTGIQIQLRDKKINEAQADQRIKALLDAQIPVLRQKAELELKAAQATGDENKILQAQQTIQQIQNLGTQTDRTGAVLKSVAGGTQNDFQTLFDSIGKGANSVQRAFGQMELGVIHSLENVASQLVANLALTLLTDNMMRLSAARTAASNTYKSVSAIPVVGWILAPIAAAAAFAQALQFAEGGLVSGPGGPTSDRVPAMLSTGEYVMKAGAVKSFGAHNLEAINAGIATTSPAFAASIARPSDFRASGLDLPAAAGAGASKNFYSHEEIHLHHNGPDARQVLEDQLVPMIREAHRRGELDFIRP